MPLRQLSAEPHQPEAAPRQPSGWLERRETDRPTLVAPLHPSLRPTAHTHDTIRLGEDSVHGVVLTGLLRSEIEPARALLHLLASAAAPLRATTLASATGLGLARVLEIAAVVGDAGLTHAHPSASAGPAGWDAWSLARLRGGGEQELHSRPPSTMAERRAGSRVVIDGRGPLTSEIARMVGAAHVGHVRMGWYAGASEDHDLDSPDPCLVVSVGTRLPLIRSRDWWDRGIVHLPVLAHGASIDIGPLLVPGQGPCLDCVRLQGLATAVSPHRLAGAELLSDGQSDVVQVEPTLGGLAAGVAAMLVLGVVDAYPPPLGVRWHTALPLPSLATSRWQVQPRCDTASHRAVGTARPLLDATMAAASSGDDVETVA